MEAIIDKAVADGTKIDAVLAENDSTALGVVGRARRPRTTASRPVSGQDGDPANLNNVALGKQYVDVWKNANELGKAAGPGCARSCARTRTSAKICGQRRPDGRSEGRATRRRTSRPRVGTTVKSFILQPTPLTADNLGQVIDAGWIHQGQTCARASTPTGAAACK